MTIVGEGANERDLLPGEEWHQYMAKKRAKHSAETSSDCEENQPEKIPDRLSNGATVEQFLGNLDYFSQTLDRLIRERDKMENVIEASKIHRSVATLLSLSDADGIVIAAETRERLLTMEETYVKSRDADFRRNQEKALKRDTDWINHNRPRE